jgi:hypothetical protein
MNKVVNSQRYEGQAKSDKLRKQYDDFRLRLHEKRSELRSLATAAGMEDEGLSRSLEKQREAEARLNRQVEATHQRLREIRLARTGAEVRLKRLEERAGENGDEREQRLSVADEVAVLRAQEEFLVDELEKLREAYPRESAMIEHSGELENKREEIEHLKSAVRKLAEMADEARIEVGAPSSVVVVEEASSKSSE